ncbi:MAG: hypothetical protein COS99_02110 [Candidatus Omnitrophica bacterium CG07_land_8_20_14_0_80_42_15]|uniref:Uncharacterized protein n=1 Tax=Candidatus Aquitaenariimonas noxiae TaxID=1974741 RepID=A0A2J0KXR3_9BACT|nr:MAG: hypothetical protein COS99_02110 [Candidatus Omnitrophica bacterium CG07_land_8_20_14_0_80_42_15]
MAQERDSTPEKQLLKLIESPAAGGVSQKQLKRSTIGNFSIAALKGRISFLRGKIDLEALLKKPPIDIKGINKVLIVLVISLSLYLGGDFIISMANLNKIPEFKLGENIKKTNGGLPEGSVLNKGSYYLEKATSRDIFKFYQAAQPKPSAEAATKKEERAEPKINDLIRDFKLVGIAWSDNPDAMIEDGNTKQIHFLKRGDKIGKDIKVEAIFKDKVILSSEGEEAELR